MPNFNTQGLWDFLSLPQRRTCLSTTLTGHSDSKHLGGFSMGSSPFMHVLQFWGGCIGAHSSPCPCYPSDVAFFLITFCELLKHRFAKSLLVFWLVLNITKLNIRITGKSPALGSWTTATSGCLKTLFWTFKTLQEAALYAIPWTQTTSIDR